MGSGNDDGAPAPLLGRHLARPVAIFGSSRLVTLAVAHAARLIEPQPLIDVLTRWDGAHYVGIATSGYPTALPGEVGVAGPTAHAFFPGYPLLIRGAAAVSGLSAGTAAVVVNLALGTVAAVLIWLLARDLAGEETATRAVLLFSFFPGAFVLGMAYSEGAFLALAAVCLLALHRRWWLAAGVAASAAGATRPTGLVLALCCAWAAGVAVRRRREWWALVAPALAPLGFLAWSAYLQAHTGSATAWKRSQELGWGQGFDAGAHTARAVGGALTAPLADFNRTVCVVTIMAAVAATVLLWRWRPPAILGIYTAGILFPAVASAVLTSTPRFALTAFPLHLAVARAASGTVFSVVVAVSSGAMVLLMAVAATSRAFTP